MLSSLWWLLGVSMVLWLVTVFLYCVHILFLFNVSHPYVERRTVILSQYYIRIEPSL
jgi:hypothetical protein